MSFSIPCRTSFARLTTSLLLSFTVLKTTEHIFPPSKCTRHFTRNKRDFAKFSVPALPPESYRHSDRTRTQSSPFPHLPTVE